MESLWSAVFCIVTLTTTVKAICPIEFNEDLQFRNEISEPINFNVYKSRKTGAPYSKRNSPKLQRDDVYTIDSLSNKLHSKSNFANPRGKSPIVSIKDLEAIITHPTWLTETNKKKPKGDAFNDKSRSIAPISLDKQWSVRAEAEDQKGHIKDIISRFQALKSNPITDNRLSKFIFSNDADVGTSKTVQQHNKEVAEAFVDFNKKLEETLNVKAGKKIIPGSDKQDMKDDLDGVVNFLEKHIHKLKDDGPHRQVCRKHKSHNDDVAEIEVDNEENTPLKDSSRRRLSGMAGTREGLENILLGLDRPRNGPFRRQVKLNPTVD